MADLELAVRDNGLIEAYRQLCLHAEDFVNISVNRTVNRVGDEVLAEFRREPGAVALPFIWKSAKQRRAFFASKGFNRGIGAERTHALVNAWRLVVVYEPNQLTSLILKNDNPAERFVTGIDQQPGHVATGWYSSAAKADQTQRRLTDEIESDLIKAWYAVDESI